MSFGRTPDQAQSEDLRLSKAAYFEAGFCCF
jgi:hypothetical protein